MKAISFLFSITLYPCQKSLKRFLLKILPVVWERVYLHHFLYLCQGSDVFVNLGGEPWVNLDLLFLVYCLPPALSGLEDILQQAKQVLELIGTCLSFLYAWRRHPIIQHHSPGNLKQINLINEFHFYILFKVKLLSLDLCWLVILQPRKFCNAQKMELLESHWQLSHKISNLPSY